MLVEIVGIKKVDYVSRKTNKPVVGSNFYYVKDLMANNSIGKETGEFYLSAVKLDSLNFNVEVGKKYEAYFNEYKQIDMLFPSDK